MGAISGAITSRGGPRGARPGRGSGPVAGTLILPRGSRRPEPRSLRPRGPSRAPRPAGVEPLDGRGPRPCSWGCGGRTGPGRGGPMVARLAEGSVAEWAASRRSRVCPGRRAASRCNAYCSWTDRSLGENWAASRAPPRTALSMVRITSCACRCRRRYPTSTFPIRR